jgi:hypothetical protein
MQRVLIAGEGVLVTMFLLGIVGCGSNQSGTATTASHEHTHEHSHAEAGPHNGHIIELGSQTHHAELTHDESTHKVGVYLLDSSAKELAPIEAESVTINVAVDGKPTQYALPATRRLEDPEGKSSYFEIENEELCAIVCGESESEDTTARVSITIDGKPYVGIIDTSAHDHGHDHGHDHSHEHGNDHSHDKDH